MTGPSLADSLRKSSTASAPAAGAALPLRLIVAHAGPADEAARQALTGLPLPNLARLLARMAPQPEASAPTAPATPAHEADLSLSLPHELALARALGLPARDGHLPWAAWQRAQAGEPADTQAWARFTPCHWAVGSDHIALRDPEALQLSDEDSRALLAAMRPYFQEDGLAVTRQAPGTWLACGEMLRELPCASLDRAVGRRVDDWLPRTPAARPLRRLQQEMQMLLYTHPVNEAREQRGLLPVNSFWVDGAGALPAGWSAPAAEEIRLEERLRRPALQGDTAAWAAAWQQLDAELLPELLQALDAGRSLSLTLAGERAAASFARRSGGAIAGLIARWRAPAPAQVLDTL